ncbi:MAG TPA: UvrD-helicase domain-containing protein [Dongiaceae bacterium]|nr:UvrD-helicase domain-containing protein [Dongiaceae bacterium]
MIDDPDVAAGPSVPPPYLAELNEAQRAAVEAMDGPVLVLAGAGTGKTRVLTTRLAHILTTGRAAPAQILAVTFTNKAAREMKDRISRLLGRPVEGWWLGTFHALAARLLRRHAEAVGLKPNFTILDTDDQVRLLKQLLQAANIDNKKWPARALLAVIERWKDRGLTPDKVTAAERGDFAGGRALDLYRAYQERLRTLNACDFGDLLLHNLTLFAAHPDVLGAYQRQFKYILVDEYQDSNVAQYLWLRLLAQGHRNLCVVGDDDQSIYGWRGAEVGNILRFETDFPGARIVRLERNYRSTPHILGAASGLIAHNAGRLGKTLWTALDEGEKIVLRGVWDGEEEARVVGEEVEALHRRGQSLGDIAILVRAGFQTREFEERFIALGIPYRVLGGPRFYERQEIRDALAYLRVLHQPDDDLAFERIVNTPRRGLGPGTLQAVHALARRREVAMTEAARRLVETDELKPAARRALARLLQDFERWRGLAATMRHTELAEIVLDDSGYTAMWQADKSPDSPGRLENLKELIAAMDEFENLGGFLEHVSLVMEATEGAQGEMVSLMTLHGAKGLEFDVVFLPGWEEGLFPHQRALDESGAAGLEEERRLAYVGLTRARRRAHVSFAANRRIHNQWQSALPSRFIDELPRDHVEIATDFGPAAAAAGRRGGGEFAERRVAPWRTRPAAGPVIDGKARTLPDAAAADSYRVGARVFHRKFGYGKVAAAEGDKLDIEFDKAGAKKVIASFVVPAERAG